MFSINIKKNCNFGEHSSLIALELCIKGHASDFDNLNKSKYKLFSALKKIDNFDSLAAIAENQNSSAQSSSLEWLSLWIKELMKLTYRHALLDSLRSIGVSSLNDYTIYKYSISLLAYDSKKLAEILRWSIACWRSCLKCDAKLENIPCKTPKFEPELKSSFLALLRACITKKITFNYCEVQPYMPTLAIGAGRSRQYISQKITSNTSNLGAIYAKRKFLLKKFLNMQGIPVSPGFEIDNFDDAVRVANHIGYPVVLKPSAMDQGIAVHTNIRNLSELKTAFTKIFNTSKQMLCEKHIFGNDYRAYIVNSKLIAICQRIPAMLKGDGYSSIKDLVTIENKYRMDNPIEVDGGLRISYTQIEIDEEVLSLLKQQSFDLNSIPEVNTQIMIKNTANFGQGGTVASCLDLIHPWNISLLLRSAESLKLDICGIDILSPDISAPLYENNGCICEINSMPGILPHMIAEPKRKLMHEILDLFINKNEHKTLVIGFNGGNSVKLIDEINVILSDMNFNVSSASKIKLTQLGFDSRGFSCDQIGHACAINNQLADIILLEIDSKELACNGLYYGEFDLFVFLGKYSEEMSQDVVQGLINQSSNFIYQDLVENLPLSQIPKCNSFSIASVEVIVNVLTEYFPKFFAEKC